MVIFWKRASFFPLVTSPCYLSLLAELTRITSKMPYFQEEKTIFQSNLATTTFTAVPLYGESATRLANYKTKAKRKIFFIKPRRSRAAFRHSSLCRTVLCSLLLCCYCSHTITTLLKSFLDFQPYSCGFLSSSIHRTLVQSSSSTLYENDGRRKFIT